MLVVILPIVVSVVGGVFGLTQAWQADRRAAVVAPERSSGPTVRLLHRVFKRTLPRGLWLRWCDWRHEHERTPRAPRLTTAQEIDRLTAEITKVDRAIAEAKRREQQETPATARRRATAEAVFGVPYEASDETRIMHLAQYANAGLITPQQMRDMDDHRGL